jgi:phosphatidylserine decarboxylase
VDQASEDVRDRAAGSAGTVSRIPIAREGWPFVAVPLVAAAVLALLGKRRAAAVVALPGLASAGFFRDPERRIPAVPGAVLAPADGRVMGVARVEDRWVGPATRVSIFLSPLDVHVNRAPIGGIVRDVEYVPGRFLAAYRPEASEDNERCTLDLEGDAMRVSVRQIAGVVARRIVCRAQPGDKLAAGERYGLIRFGSRTDLIVPRAAQLRVDVGDRVTGGESIMAMLG